MLLSKWSKHFREAVGIHCGSFTKNTQHPLQCAAVDTMERSLTCIDPIVEATDAVLLAQNDMSWQVLTISGASPPVTV